MNDRIDWIENETRALAESGLLRQFKTRESPPVAGMVQIDGRQFINFGSNDYLGIAASQPLVYAVENTIGQVGFGSGASQLVNGRGTLHRRLERELAAFEGTESALLFPTGYAANVGTISSLVGKQDAVFSDQLNHASIIDGCRLSQAKTHVYPHNDLQFLEELLASEKTARRRLIVTDSLFSMDGDFAKLPELCEIVGRTGAMLMVDEAHATGVFGAHGRGACEKFEVEHLVDVRVGTLSKSLGGIGGFVVGSKRLTDWLLNTARPQIFSTAMPEVCAAAAIAALEVVQQEPERREQLLRLSEKLRHELVQSGCSIAGSESQIVPIVIGKSEDAVKVSQELAEQGIYVPAIRPPAVPEGKSRLRVSVCSQHTEGQLEKLTECLLKFASPTGKFSQN